MKKILLKTVSVILVLICIFNFSGCSMFDFFSAESLLKSPKLTGEKAKLQLAFENKVGVNIRLFTPVAGDNRGSYIIFDANHDGNDEAVVFYSFNSNSSVVHMHILSQINDEWYSVGDFTGSGTEVYKVDFFNIDSTNNLEIGVIWSLDDSQKEKTLSIYRISSLEADTDNSLVSLATIQIADYVHCNVDDDDANELLYFYFESEKGSSSTKARLIDYDSLNENFIPISEVKLPFSFSAISRIVSDKENDNLRFYVDCLVSGGVIFSEMLVFDYENGALFIPQTSDKYISSISSREYDLYCSDFNNDGYIDIPVSLDSSESFFISDSDEADVSLVFTEWYTFLDRDFMSLGKYFMNRYDEYALKFDALYEKYYVVYDYINRVTQVRLKNYEAENNIVFSISYVTADDLVNILPDGLLGEKNDIEYKIVISAKGETLGFSENYIRSLITEL